MQQDDSKKLLDTKFSFGGDFKEHITKYLGGIDAEYDGKYELLTNKNSKYLFYDYNDFLLMKNIEAFRVRHKKISEDFFGLIRLIIRIESWVEITKKDLETINKAEKK